MRFDLPLFPEQASTVATRVDALYFFLVGVSVFFAGLIFILVITFAVKYRHRPGNTIASAQIDYNIPLEIFWTVIPLALTMIMFAWGASVYFSMHSPPNNALEVFVVGRQWMWKFQHPDGQREINELHVPVGRPVKLVIASEDVIHSFFVPAFRVKQDAVPGRYTSIWFEATKTGTFHMFCAEYCGTQHSGMIGRVVVLEPAQYAAWLGGETGAAGTAVAAVLPGAEGSVADRGQRLFQQLGCNTCHLLDRQGIGPVLRGVFGSEVRLQDGRTVLADENYVRESILQPQAKITAGFQPLMPSFQGRVNEEQLMQLIAYVRTLGRPSVPPQAVPALPPPSDPRFRTGVGR
jgi:cytochrome c oxidase subunit 2